jgi:hypothetical protein
VSPPSGSEHHTAGAGTGASHVTAHATEDGAHPRCGVARLADRLAWRVWTGRGHRRSRTRQGLVRPGIVNCFMLGHTRLELLPQKKSWPPRGTTVRHLRSGVTGRARLCTRHSSQPACPRISSRGMRCGFAAAWVAAPPARRCAFARAAPIWAELLAPTTLLWIARVVDDNGENVTFGCPTARGRDERGGPYALYTGPLLPGDAAAKVTCTARQVVRRTSRRGRRAPCYNKRSYCRNGGLKWASNAQTRSTRMANSPIHRAPELFTLCFNANE